MTRLAAFHMPLYHDFIRLTGDAMYRENDDRPSPHHSVLLYKFNSMQFPTLETRRKERDGDFRNTIHGILESLVKSCGKHRIPPSKLPHSLFFVAMLSRNRLNHGCLVVFIHSFVFYQRAGI